MTKLLSLFSLLNKQVLISIVKGAWFPGRLFLMTKNNNYGSLLPGNSVPRVERSPTVSL